MSEYIDLIQKEKEDALRNYQEDAFNLNLNKQIAKDSKPSRSYVQWFRKSVFAGSSVLLILFLGWLSTHFFLPSSQVPESRHIKNTLVQLFSQHRNILNQSPLQVDPGDEKSVNSEFEWSLKRVILAIQRENTQDEDIVQNLSKVLQNAAVLLKAENSKSGELNI